MDKIILIMVICFSKTITRGSWGTIRTGLSPRKQKIRLIRLIRRQKIRFIGLIRGKKNISVHIRSIRSIVLKELVLTSVL